MAMRSLASTRVPTTSGDVEVNNYCKPISTCGYYYVPSESDQFVGLGRPMNFHTKSFSTDCSRKCSAQDPRSTRANDCLTITDTVELVGAITTTKINNTVVSSSNQTPTQTKQKEQHQQQPQKWKKQTKITPSCVARNRCRRPRTGRKIQLRKERQTYDMNQVPRVKANPLFLTAWRNLLLSLGGTTPSSHVTSNSSNETNKLSQISHEAHTSHRKERGDLRHGNISPTLPCLVPCDGASLETNASSATHDITDADDNDSHSPTHKHSKSSYHPPHICHSRHNNNSHFNCDYSTPFATDFESLLWEPSSRDHWIDSIEEMTAVCTAASRKRHQSLNKPSNEIPPLNVAYIKERVDIDDPLQGYQIRHATGGWLQGFIMTTTFTSWTYWFKWDSHDVQGNGMLDRGGCQSVINDDGQLAMDLDDQPRSGDPKDSGVVWPTVAEIVLIGALGCGEYLVQLALDRMAQQGYKYVVLEATEASRPFYERLGFVRVGALAKYGTEEQVVGGGERSSEDGVINVGEVEVQGYSHWAPADMPKELLKKRGPPSCMMGRTLLSAYCLSGSGRIKPWPFHGSFGEQLADHFIKEKPAIRPIGHTGRSQNHHNQNNNLGHKRAISSVITPTNNCKSKRVRTFATISPPPRFVLSNPSSKTPDDVIPTPLSIELTPPKQPSPHRTLSNTLLKQNISNMYRHPKTIYYYNKVVMPVHMNLTLHKSKYYFVLHYNAPLQQLRLIPLQIDGTFSKGARIGKPKWKARLESRQVEMDEITDLKGLGGIVDGVCNEWEIVKSLMVTKCKSVENESWCIL